jgi:hypothetical protein
MNEKEMQELLWRYPERLLNEPLRQFGWEVSSDVGRADLVFEDRHGRLLIIEVKKGKLQRGAIDQLLDYFGMMKLRFPERAVELMVVANVIPPERQIACENRDIECRAIAEKTFRDVAAEVGYVFASELSMSRLPTNLPTSSSTGRHTAGSKETQPWSFSRTVQPPGDEQDFLSRCDEEGRRFFTALFEAQKAAPSQTRITWNHKSGFSMQFYFHRIGFAPIVWGFPAKNREGKSVRQRLDFPFDFSVKAGVPEAFVGELGAALSSLVPFSGGGKRPSIPIVALQADEITQIIQTIFTFAVRSSKAQIRI